MPSLSVIIPTHRRPDTLKTCLEHLERQSIASELEVIIANDVRHDTNVKELSRRNWQMSTRILDIEPCQQGIARNRAIEVAHAPLCLFIGDDIFLESRACEAHVADHEEFEGHLAVLGFTTWDPAVGITPVMRWLEHTGWQFGYRKIKRFERMALPSAVQHLFTYTSNISVTRDTAKAIPFREDITLYGWEDIEWGKRLANVGVQIFYEPNAGALHHHHITMQDSLRRMETLGESVVTLTKATPHLDRLPRGLKRLGYECAALLPTMAGKHRKAFLKGIKRETEESS